MTEVVKINLENEMDLILAHKRSMKLAELCGLSVIQQTAFATAVSEISRCIIGNDDIRSSIALGINPLRNNRKELMAVLVSNMEFGRQHDNSVKYATRLADTLKINSQKNKTEVVITEKINFSGLLNEARVESFINYFKKELPLSPYDELRKKNIQLLELSEKLKDSEDQYRRLTETLPQMVFTMNTAGFLTYANYWLKEHFGLTDITAGKLSWTSLLDIPEYKNLYPAWEKAQLTRTPFKAQARLKARQGAEPLWHLISLIPFENEEKQLQGWNGFFVDIHAQKVVEETLKNNVELKVAQRQLLSTQARLEANVKELNKSNHDLEQFAYIASHDLQEPLRKIRNFTELLGKNLSDPAKADKYLEKIDSASSRMSTLIKDVLNYSRLSKAGDHFEESDLQRILENVKSDVELIIEEKKAKITAQPLPVIIGMPLQLHQLFYNLINNALKFSTEKPVITIGCRKLEAAEIEKHPDLHGSVNYIELLFKDNGIGFEQKYAEQVFTIFKRLNARDSFEGTGIGLALCKKITDNHHGSISAESEPGKGTAFRVILPVA